MEDIKVGDYVRWDNHKAEVWTCGEVLRIVCHGYWTEVTLLVSDASPQESWGDDKCEDCEGEGCCVRPRIGVPHGFGISQNGVPGHAFTVRAIPRTAAAAEQIAGPDLATAAKAMSQAIRGREKAFAACNPRRLPDLRANPFFVGLSREYEMLHHTDPDCPTDTFWTCIGDGPVCWHRFKSTDPLDVLYDGVRLGTLLEGDEFNRREVSGSWKAKPMTTVQRAAVSAHWSAQLRAKVEASRQKERNVVSYVEVDADD